jgi:phytoene desaturase
MACSWIKQSLHMGHAVIIGSGFGGLAAAVRLLAKGWTVEILERRDRPGGRAYVYEQDGFRFDGGPTVITAPFLFEELWSLLGHKLSDDVEMLPVTPFYRIRMADGEWFNYSEDADAMREQVRRISPGDVEGYERFMELSKRIYEVGFEQLAHKPFSRWTDMLSVAPQMLKLRSYRTVWGLVSSFMKDERLRQIFSFHPLLVGGNPFDTTSIYSLICHLERAHGVWFPRGGTGALVRGLVGLIERHGGVVHCDHEVEKIVVESGRATGVRLSDGEVRDADIVVSNADSAWLYTHMVDEDVSRHWTPKKVAKAKFSMGLFVWYFGTNRKYEHVAHHSILLGPRYRELLEDIFQRKILADDFSLYLHRPTASDADLAPPGHDGFYVLSPVPHLDSGVDWQAEAEEYKEKIAQHLEQTLMPGLRDSIVTSRVLTPLQFRDDLLSLKGSGFGMQPVLGQSAYFRPHNRADIENLFLVGAGTHPGAGVPGVLSSARVLDELVQDAPVAPGKARMLEGATTHAA